MATIKPFDDAGEFTTFPNSTIDKIMPLCTPEAWMVLCATLRLSNKSDNLALVDLHEIQRLTQIGDDAVASGLVNLSHSATVFVTIVGIEGANNE